MGCTYYVKLTVFPTHIHMQTYGDELGKFLFSFCIEFSVTMYNKILKSKHNLKKGLKRHRRKANSI